MKMIYRYVVPFEEKEKLEKLIQRMAEERNECKISGLHKITMIKPSILKKNGIKFGRVTEIISSHVILI